MSPVSEMMLSILYRLNDNRSLCYHDMHEEPSALLAAAILFIGILIAVPFSALAQQQQSIQYDSRMEKDNKALVRSFVEEEVFNDHIIEVQQLSTMHNILYKTIHKQKTGEKALSNFSVHSLRASQTLKQPQSTGLLS